MTTPRGPRSSRDRRLRRAARVVVADLTPLRVSADYRRLWSGYTVSHLGQQMTAVAVAIQVFAITSSSFAVGLVGLFALGPLVLFGLYGGAISDAMDRRRLGLLTGAGLWVMSVVLAVQALLGARSPALLYAVVAVQSACYAVNNPTRAAMIPRLLPVQLLPAANALASLSMSVGFTLGPLLAGVLIGGVGLPAAYLVDCLTFTAALYAIWRLPPMPPTGEVRGAGLASVLEGLRFLRSRPNVLMTFLVDLAAMVLAQPRALFPALAVSSYGGGTRTVGLLTAAPAIGSMIGALCSGWLGRVRRQGLVVLGAVAAYGGAVAAFGLSHLLMLGLALLALSGLADMVSAVFRTTILQAATPDELRGRLQGVFIVVVAGGPRLGDFVMGSVASLRGETFAVVTGGCACVAAVGLLAARHPGFARYDARRPVP
jgi:MFS family permease